ncbi:MAG: ribonuclease Z [Candidatus Methanomethylophilaceae archaeon]|nr:ribonuclease Z [Candidatus Methanomethylophilaceae archaeon]
MMELLFLGTGASVPSRDRATSCIAVRVGPDIVLMDCGEGSQRQLMVSPFSFMKIRTILITHMHGDHVFGLPGLLQTMSLSGRRDPLTVYGPVGLAHGVSAMMSVTEGETQYPLEVVELEGGETFDVCGLRITAYATSHGTPSVGFTVREPDRPGRPDRARALELGVHDGPEMALLKAGETVNGVSPSEVVGPPTPGASVSYTGDTVPCPGIVEASAGVDVLIHESTYMSSESEMAADHFHSTASQAAVAAREAGVRCLMLTHVSNRYDDRSLVEAEAREHFPEVVAVEDMDLFEITSRGVRRASR